MYLNHYHQYYYYEYMYHENLISRQNLQLLITSHSTNFNRCCRGYNGQGICKYLH